MVPMKEGSAMASENFTEEGEIPSLLAEDGVYVLVHAREDRARFCLQRQSRLSSCTDFSGLRSKGSCDFLKDRNLFLLILRNLILSK